jgi:signal transduction histidine kinase
MGKVRISEPLKVAFVGLLLALCLLAIYWFHHVEKTDVLFTHFFYLPIILASLWWTYKGTAVALFLALLLPITHILGPLETPVWEDLVRSFFFLVIGITVAVLSERRKNLEEGLRQYSRTLEDRVRARTEELSARNQELEAYSYTISHDLNAPLTVIEGYAELVEKNKGDVLGVDGKEYLSNIINSVKRIKHLTNSLLEYARAGRTEGEITRVDTEESVREILMERKLDIQRLGVKVKVQKGLPALEVDPVKLSQVLSNLMDNAFKYMGDNPMPMVDIGGEKKDLVAILYVRDNGVGIPPEEKESIFEPFKRFESDGAPGLGIGLSTVKRAVEAWGGKVWVESTPGEGSTFFFTAPCAD